MLIQVTQEHIDNGVRFSALTCPIALACRQALDSDYCSAGLFEIRTDRTSFKTPKEVAAKMRDYDSGLGMKEFSFELK